MEQASLSSRRLEEYDFNSRKARITRENPNSRRFSASNIPSFREETRSFRQSIGISSTASSPGYTSKDLIDPSTYSFTAALKALQERSGAGWEYLSSIKSIYDGNALNSKWCEAEKYISNPLSGEVPMECLSAKTLSGRCISSSTRITKSAPLVFSNARLSQTRPEITFEEEEAEEPPSIQEMKKEEGHENHGALTRDVGTQSTPPDLRSSGSTSPATTPSIKQRSFSSCLLGVESPTFHIKSKPEQEEDGWMEKQMEGQKGKKEEEMWKCRFGGCLALGSWQRKLKRNRKIRQPLKRREHNIEGVKS